MFILYRSEYENVQSSRRIYEYTCERHLRTKNYVENEHTRTIGQLKNFKFQKWPNLHFRHARRANKQPPSK